MEKSEQFILQRKLADCLISDIFHTIVEDDILKQTDGKWTHKGIVLTEGQIKVLKKEAKQFSESRLSKILTDELQWHARNKLEQSQTEQDIIASKLLSYFCDLFNTKIKKITNL